MVVVDFGDVFLLDKGCIVVDVDCKINLVDVWVGGDCVVGGEDLMVVVVEDGKIVVEFIYVSLGV